jgi:hypothetical protein
MKRFLFIAAFISCGFFLRAQNPAEAEGVLDKTDALIGEPVKFKLKVRYTEGMQKAVVGWPEFSDSLTAGIEVLGSDSITTRMVDRASVLYEQSRSITIVSFDTGMYTIPPVKFTVDGKVFFSNPVNLHISTVAIDTTKPIHDIKAIYDVPPAPPVIEEPKPVNWMMWGLIAAGALIIIGFIIWMTRKKPEPVIVPERVVLPHDRVLQLLDELAAKKQWLNGDLKGYYIALTEIMRGWLVERYRFHALEMTTAEIIRVLRLENVPPAALEQITQVLRTADMVKFAKSVPDARECEQNLSQSKNFVQATALIPIPVAGPGLSPQP